MEQTKLPGQSIAMPALPGPRPLPLLGRRGQKLRFYHDPIAYHCHVYRTYGTLAAFVEGGHKLLVYGPDYNRQILSQTEVFHCERIALPGPPGSALARLGVGLNVMNGELHRQRRRLIMPAFHKGHVAGYRDTIVGAAQRALDRWRVGEVREIGAEMRQITRWIVGQILFGLDDPHGTHALVQLLDRWFLQATSIAPRLWPFTYPGSPYQKLLALSERVEAHVADLIAQRRASPDGRRDVLALLLQASAANGGEISDAELFGQITLFFLAGFETTAAALTWTLFLLAQHPPIMADLLDELADALHGEAPAAAQLDGMPLLDAVIKESLRLLPPAIQGGRTAVQPFELGAFQFPAGAKVMYSQYITHRMPDIYARPQQFWPERWRTIAPSPYAYLPFLAGPHMCIGAPLALLEMKIILSMLLQRFRLTLAPNTTIDRSVRMVLAPKNGMPMRIDPQDRQFAHVAVRGNIRTMVDLA
jgi:cytochrome P450